MGKGGEGEEAYKSKTPGAEWMMDGLTHLAWGIAGLKWCRLNGA